MTDEELRQRTHTAILEHFVDTGRAPHFTELADTLAVSPDEALEAVHYAADRGGLGCWVSHETDYIASWAPFSSIPTQYLISIDGEHKWYGQCGVESLAVRWLFPGREVTLDARCLDCGEPIMVRFRDDEILEVDPPSTVGHVNVPPSRWSDGSSEFA